MTLEEYLKERVSDWERVGHHALLERFVLRNGKPFTPIKRRGRKGKPKQCYMNAAKFVLRNPGARATYVEGFAVNREIGFPFLHAWVTFDGTDAMDPTLDSKGYDYFGVTFDQAVLFREIHRNDCYGILDIGLGLNSKLMFEIDPALEPIVRAIKPRNFGKLIMELKNESPDTA